MGTSRGSKLDRVYLHAARKLEAHEVSEETERYKLIGRRCIRRSAGLGSRFGLLRLWRDILSFLLTEPSAYCYYCTVHDNAWAGMTGKSLPNRFEYLNQTRRVPR